jgi:hypothetical protein
LRGGGTGQIAGQATTTKGQSLLNTETLTQLLTDPELREQIPRLLRRKIQADASSLEANAFVSKQLISLVRRTKNGKAAANALREVIKDHLNFCETLVNLQFAFNNTLMEKLRTISDAEMPAPSTVTMNLTATRDAVVRMPFRIENNRRAAIFVDFETTPFASEDGIQLVVAEVVFDPSSLELQPEQEAKIELIVKVGEQFKPGTTYLATVTVRGLDAPNLLVRLQVEPAQDLSASPPPSMQTVAVETTGARAAKAKPGAGKAKRAVARSSRPSKGKRQAP